MTRRQLIREGKRRGFRAEFRRSGHIRLTLRPGVFVTTASSPSDVNSWVNALRDMDRLKAQAGEGR